MYFITQLETHFKCSSKDTFHLSNYNAKAFEIFIDTIKPHERTTHLAYLIAHKEETRTNRYKTFFENFKIVGKKTGQLVETFGLMDQKIVGDLSDLKDNAAPLSRAEIIQILKDTLGEEEYRKKIRSIDKIVGSASIKTVVQATLKDGRKIAIAVQDPYALEQINTQLKVVKKYIQKLIKHNIITDSVFIKQLVISLERQLIQSINMHHEASYMREMGRIYSKINKIMKNRLDGFKFQVPKVIDDLGEFKNILFMDLIDDSAVPWDKIQKNMLKKQIGQNIVESSLISLFRYGRFDADRHKRQQLIQEDGTIKIINMLDMGEIEKFKKHINYSKNEIIKLAEFIRCIGEKNPKELIQTSLRMVAEKIELSHLQLITLENSLKTALKEKNKKKQFQLILKAFNNLGIKFEDKYSVGLFKGLITLYGEKFADENFFDMIINREIKSVLIKNSPLRLLNDIITMKKKARLNKCLNILRKDIANGK